MKQHFSSRELFASRNHIPIDTLIEKHLMLPSKFSERIVTPIEKEKYLLPNVYEQYLNYYATTRQTGNRRIKSIRRVLAAFDGYLENTKIKLATLTIEQIDAFFADFNANFTPSTCKVYRSIVRGFLSYLFHQRHTLKRDLAVLVVGAPIFAHKI
jgi:hypothetical protein